MEKKNYIPLEDLTLYRMAMEVGDAVWKLVATWAYFPKQHLGGQFIEAADSIAANISEGYGRYHFKDKKNFYFFARGSLSETKTWLTKAYSRNLVSPEDYTMLYQKLKELHVCLNQHLKAIPSK